MDEVEKYSRRRRLLLLGMAIAFLAWQVPMLEIFNQYVEENRTTIYLTSLFAFFLWGGALVLLMRRRGFKGASASTQLALEDELVRANRSRAFMVGYITMMGLSALLFVLAIFFPVPPHDIAQLVLVAGVVSPMLTFAWLEGRGG